MFKTGSDSFMNRIIFVACLVSVATIVVFLGYQSSATPGLFDLRLNLFGGLSAIAAVTNVVLLTRLLIAHHKSDESTWFIFALMANLVFTSCEALERLAVHLGPGIFWGTLSTLGVSFVPVGFFLFALAYTKPSTGRFDILTPLVTITGGIVVFFYAFGDIVYSRQPDAILLTKWGYTNNAGPGFWVVLLWLITLYTLAIIVLIRFWRRNTNQVLRRQARLYTLALSIPLVAGFFTDGLTSLFQDNAIPSMEGVLSTCVAIIIFYGLRRYQFFQLNPAILSQNILSTMNESVIVTRDDFTIEYVNQEAEQLLGAKLSDLAATRLNDLFAPTSWPKIDSRLVQGQADISELGDLSVINREGKSVPVRVVVSQLLEAEAFHAYIFVISDITALTESYNKLEADATQIRHLLDEAHTLERQLETEKASVEHTVEVRTRELRQAQERLKAADAMKTEFMILSSHNLRTPITVMAGSLEMLRTSDSPEERSGFLDSLDASVKRIKEFVEDMLTITSLETGNGFSLHATSADDILTPLLAEATSLAAARDLTFTTAIQDGDTLVNANNLLLQGALRSVFDNAVKFTKTGGITLTAKRDGDRYLISCSDTGIGIAPDEIPKLFTKFHRGTDAMKFSYEGEGIGLYLTKLIVDEHGGSVKVTSDYGAGTEVHISLPVASATVAQPDKS